MLPVLTVSTSEPVWWEEEGGTVLISHHLWLHRCWGFSFSELGKRTKGITHQLFNAFTEEGLFIIKTSLTVVPNFSVVSAQLGGKLHLGEHKWHLLDILILIKLFKVRTMLHYFMGLKKVKSQILLFLKHVQTKRKEKLSNFVIFYMEMNSFREKFLHFYLFISQMFIEFLFVCDFLLMLRAIFFNWEISCLYLLAA